MSQNIYKIMYSSSAIELLNSEALDMLMQKSRFKNAHFGVTGCLIYHDGNIMQYLEGPESSVEFIYASIKEDSRHKDIALLCNDWIEQRAFSDWTMALRYIPEDKLSDYQTVYDLFEGMMETQRIDKLCKQAKIFFKTFLDVTRLQSGNMGLS